MKCLLLVICTNIRNSLAINLYILKNFFYIDRLNCHEGENLSNLLKLLKFLSIYVIHKYFYKVKIKFLSRSKLII